MVESVRLVVHSDQYMEWHQTRQLERFSTPEEEECRSEMYKTAESLGLELKESWSSWFKELLLQASGAEDWLMRLLGTMELRVREVQVELLDTQNVPRGLEKVRQGHVSDDVGA